MIIGVTAQSFLKSKELCLCLASTYPHAEIRYASKWQVEQETELAKFVSGLTHWIVGRERVDESLLSRAHSLRLISKYGVGLDNVDIDACKRFSVGLEFKPGVNALAVAEHSLALILSLSRNIFRVATSMKKGKWLKDGGFGLSAKRVGIVGLGKVGCELAKVVKVFGAQVVYSDIEDKLSEASALGVSLVSFDELLATSDIVSLHVPLTSLTRNMISSPELSKMKATALLINTSRGEVVDQLALMRALRDKKLAGAGLDVFWNEPTIDKDLISLDCVIATSHTAGNSEQAVWAMGQAAIFGLSRGSNSDS